MGVGVEGDRGGGGWVGWGVQITGALYLLQELLDFGLLLLTSAFIHATSKMIVWN